MIKGSNAEESTFSVAIISDENVNIFVYYKSISIEVFKMHNSNHFYYKYTQYIHVKHIKKMISSEMMLKIRTQRMYLLFEVHGLFIIMMYFWFKYTIFIDLYKNKNQSEL